MATQYTREEEYIISKSAEVSVGEVVGWSNKVATFFPALRNQNFRRYFYGNLVSLIGTWLQIVAQGWLVLKLTNSPFLVGLVAAASSLPTLFIAPFGGVIVDRFPKRKILIMTQIVEMTLAFILGFLTITQLITIWEIIALSLILGINTAIDLPARQAFVAELVDREHLPSAIALNSGAFNSARVVGPSIAGLLIAFIGIGGAFIVNGLSFFAVLLALIFIKIKEVIHDTHPHPITAIKQGILYAKRHPVINVLLIFTGLISIFGWSYATIMPVLAQNVFQVGADGLGYLYAVTGIGAVLATITVSSLSKKISSEVFILGGNFLFTVALIGFSYTHTLIMAFPFLFFAGFGLLAQFSMINTILQQMVEDKFRGRVMSLFIIMFLGLMPFGNLQVGFLAEHLGAQMAIRIGAVILFITGLFMLSIRKRIHQAYEVYRKERDE